MQQFNFKVQLIDMAQNWGIKVNGTWNGVIGMVNSSKADLGMCQLGPIYPRHQVVQFSEHTIVDSLTTWSCAPKPKQYPFMMSLPFTPSVWAFIWFTILILSIFQYFNSQDTLFLALFKHYTVFVRQTISFTSNVPTSRILYCLWLFLSMVLSTCYLGVFHSILTLIEYEDPLDTPEAIEDALVNDRVILVTRKNFSYSNMMRYATPNDSSFFYTLRQHHDRHNQTFYPDPVAVRAAIFHWKNKKSFLIIGLILYLNHINAFFKGHQNFFVSQYNYLSAPCAIAFPHNSSLLLPFNSVFV